MLRRLRAIVGFLLSVIGLAGLADDISKWQAWLSATLQLFPSALSLGNVNVWLLVVGVPLLVSAVPRRWWYAAWSGRRWAGRVLFREKMDLEYGPSEPFVWDFDQVEHMTPLEGAGNKVQVGLVHRVRWIRVGIRNLTRSETLTGARVDLTELEPRHGHTLQLPLPLSRMHDLPPDVHPGALLPFDLFGKVWDSGVLQVNVAPTPALIHARRYTGALTAYAQNVKAVRKSFVIEMAEDNTGRPIFQLVEHAEGFRG